jgi:tetratricopeptide (TPR) repeat protein
MIPGVSMLLWLIPGAALAALLLFFLYVLLLFLRIRLAVAAENYDRAIRLEKRLASLLHWKSFTAPRLLDLYLSAARKDDEAMAVYEATFDTAQERKKVAGRIAALMRVEELDRFPDLGRRVFTYLYDEGVRSPLTWELMKELALRDGDEEKAIAILREWMDELPNREVCLELRDLYLQREDVGPDAEEMLRKSLAWEGDHEPTNLRLYDIFSHRWDTSDEAYPVYRKVLGTQPDLEWANSAVAEILLRRGEKQDVVPFLVRGGQHQKALQILMERFGASPSDPWALRWICEVIIREERIDSHSLGVCHRYVEAGGTDPEVLDFLFRVYNDRRERSREAIAVFEAYRSSRPDDLEGLRALAKAYRDTGRLRDAVWLLEEGLEDFPGNLHLMRDLARTFRSQGVRSDKALQRAAEYLEYEWDEDIGAYLKEVVVEGGGDRDIALRVFRRWLEAHPEDAEVLRALARIYLDEKDAINGVPVFRKLVELGHEQPWVVRGMADLYSASNDRSESAEQVYARAVNMGVAGDHVITTLAEICLDRDRRDGFALEIIGRAAGLPHCPPFVKVELARIHYDMGAFESTLSLCREVLDENPGDIEAQRWMAKAHMRLGTQAEAYRKLEMVLAERPDDPQVVSELVEAYVAAGVTSPESIAVYERFLAAIEEGRIGEISQIELNARKLAGLAGFRTGQFARGFAALRFLYEESPSTANSLALAASKEIDAPRERERLASLALEFGDVGVTHRLIVSHCLSHPDRVDFVVTLLRKARREHGGTLGQVMEIFEELVEKDLLTVKLLGELASCHILSGDVDMAARRWRRLLALTHDREREGPPLPGALEKRMGLSDTDVSRLLGRALNLHKRGVRHWAVFLVAGRLFLRKQDPQKATAYLQKARELAPGDREVAHFLRFAYRRLLTTRPSDSLREKLADLLMAEEEWDEAIVELQRISSDYPRGFQITVKLSKCFMEKGYPKVASQEIERALAGSEPAKDNLEIYYTLGVAYQLAGEGEKARLTFERIGFLDYSYRDVRKRLEEITAEPSPAVDAMVPPAPRSADPRVTIGDLATREFDLSQIRHERFEIVESVGQGGMAVVYKAMDHEFDPPLLVALKILPQEFARSEKAVRLFKREAAAAIKLNHENIVRIYSTGEEGGSRYISMEYIDGPDLGSVVARDGSIDARRVVRILRGVLAGLGYAHRQGVFHKDIKPSNIMMAGGTGDGTVKITDFGIARLLSEEATKTQTVSIRGTLPYMSPQQISGEPAGASDDLYSLGITLYELLSGDPPFIRGDIAYQQTTKPPVPLDEVARDVPPFLERIVMRCLEKEPARRYAHAGEILAELE